jgi:hypothetical protein
MADTPKNEKDEKPAPLPFVQPVDTASPTVVALTGRMRIYASMMGFGSFVYVPPSDGYAPDPHDDPVQLLEIFLKADDSKVTDKALVELLDAIYKLAGKLNSKISRIERGWYLIFLCLMHQVPREIIDGIMRTQTNGLGHKKIVLEVANSILPKESDIRQFLIDLDAQSNALMQRRNAAAHSVIEITAHLGDSSFVITGTTKPSRLPRVPRQVKEELDACLTEADRLIDAVKHFLMHADTASYSSPALVSPQLKAGWNNPLQKNPVKKPAQKKHQPQS